MKIEKTPAEQAEFDRMCLYFKFEARREYLRIQTTQNNEFLELEQWFVDNQGRSEEKLLRLKKQQAELKAQ